MNQAQYAHFCAMVPKLHRRIERAERRVDKDELPFCMLEHVSPYKKLPVLVEEVGEVAKEIQDGTCERMIEELLDVASGAIAWAIALELER